MIGATTMNFIKHSSTIKSVKGFVNQSIGKSFMNKKLLGVIFDNKYFYKCLLEVKTAVMFLLKTVQRQ